MKLTTKKDYILFYQLLIENIQNNAEVQNIVSTIGYDAEKMQEGRELLDKTLQAFNMQILETADKLEATDDLSELRETVHKNYMKALKIARVVFDDDIKAQTALMLNGKRKTKLAGWLLQVNTFYQNLLSEENNFIGKMAARGQSYEKLSTDYVLVMQITGLSVKKKVEKGEAKQATKRKNEAFDELKKWANELVQIAKVTFEDSDESLDKLGIVA